MLIFSVRRLWLIVALFALVTATGSVTAWQLTRPAAPGAVIDLIAQGEDVICPPGEADCTVEDDDEQTDPGIPGEEGGDGEGGACTWTRGPILASLAAAQVTIEIPCYLDAYGWYGGDSCYYGDFPKIREATGGIPEPPEGKTEEDGRYYYLSCFVNVDTFNGEYVFTWLAVERWVWVDFEDVPTVTPEQVALAWLAQITLQGVEFRLAPPTTGAGLVGLPVWLGVEQPETENSIWGPTGDDHCIGGVCVTIEAIVTDVDWNLGDGTVINCTRDQHKVWHRGMDFLAPGGNCHHYYQGSSRNQPGGRYEITATSNWEVRWSDTSGPGAPLTTSRTSTTSLQIDEIQVLTGR